MTQRKGQPEYTKPFALGQFYNDFVYSVGFNTPLVGAVPILAEFNKAGTNPSGSRHLTTHPSFVSILASGEGVASFQFDNLDMNSTDISFGSGISKTKVFLFRIRQFDCLTSRAHGMKVWVSNDDDFLTKDTHKVVYQTSTTWLGNISLPVSYMKQKIRWLPTSLPEFPNLRRQDGKYTIHGSGDADVSEWIYIAVAASGTLPLAQYGSTQASGFLVRVSYSIDNIGLFD